VSKPDTGTNIYLQNMILGGTDMKNFFKDESGQGMVEYGLIIALIAIGVIAALKLLGPAISGIFTEAQTELNAI
jgi:pilus assembly protein Flp/PilA